MSIIKTIQARASEKALTKVTRLFNAGLQDILNELLQNSRRAGATVVKVEVLTSDRSYLSISDNGSGIDDPAILLALGDSDWQEETRDREDPAGMGIFSLANRGAEIHSNGWSVRLEPSHFCGEVSAQAYESAQSAGTQIIFPLEPYEVQKVRPILAQVARYYPLPVEFEGERLKREDFLKDALYLEEWQGLKIGVFWLWHADLENVNFYGITPYHSFPSVAQVGETLRWGIKIEVVDCPSLKLVLPARKELVQDRFLAELKTEALRVMYRYVRTLESHRLSYASWKQAAELGIVLPEAKASLARFSPEPADFYLGSFYEEGDEIGKLENPLILDITELDAYQQQMFWRGFSHAQLPYTAVLSQPQYKGYSWYDRLPVVSTFHFTIDIEGETLSARAFEERYGGQAKVFVDAITVVAFVTLPDGSQIEIAFPSDVYCFREEYWHDLDEVLIALTRDHRFDVEALAEFLEAAYFAPSEESDDDSYETQKMRFREEARVRAIDMLVSGEEALKQQIGMVLEREVQWFVPQGVRVEITLTQNAMTVRLEEG